MAELNIAFIGNPNDPAQLNPKYLFENDYLHPNADGYVQMGDCIDLKLFERKGNPGK